MIVSASWIILWISLMSKLAEDHKINKRADFSCNGLSNGKYKHENDCRKFYWCLNNNKISDSCGENLAFSVSLGSCRPSSEVPDCKDGTGVVTEGSIIVATSPPTDFSCLNRPDGFYRHPDCKKYYRCYSKKLQINNCPKDLYFNPEYVYCDYPSNVPDCVGGTINPDKISVVTTTTPKVPVVGFCTGKPNGNYRHNECSKFYNCYNGQTTILSCSNGQVFNQNVGYCTDVSKVPECGGDDKDPTLEGKLSCANKDDGFYRHPDCTKFYRCINKQLFEKSCPPNLYYNPEYFYCDYPANVPDCIGGTAKVDTDSQPPTSSSADFCAGKKNGFYSHPDCSKFYSCYKEKASLMSCSYGLAFDPQTEQCVSEYKVSGCKTKLVFTRNLDDDFNCNGKHSGLYKHSECSKFYSCQNSEIQVLDCPEGLVFNSKKQMCDALANVPECRSRKKRVVPDEDFTCDDKDDGYYEHEDCNLFYQCLAEQLFLLNCPPNLVYNPKKEICDWPGAVPRCRKVSTTTAVPLPPEDGNIYCQNLTNGAYPISDDCHNFYRCLNGRSKILPCPTGLVFNPIQRWCDWPHNVPNCTHIKNKRSSEPAFFSCKFLPNGYYKHPDCSKFYKCSNENLSIVSCPQDLVFNRKIENCDFVESVPECNPDLIKKEQCKSGEAFRHSDCSKYFICFNNVLHLKLCPWGTVFNIKKGICDWDNDVPECSLTDVEPEKPTDVSKMNFSCLHQDNKFFRNLEDCGSFFECQYEEMYFLRCPKGLAFNQEMNYCDWPSNVPECNHTKIEKTNNISQDQPCSNQGNGFYKHEICNKFYRCMNKLPYVLSCPENLVFNEKLSNCDWPENVPHCRNTSTMSRTKVVRQVSNLFTCVDQPDGYYKHESCSKFYRCISETSIEQVCPTGLVFNDNIGMCDWPVNVPACDSKHDNTEDVSETQGFSCKGVADGFYKHPNCRLYYRCISGIVSEESCPKGFFFNSQRAYCDWKANVPECRKPK